MMQTSTEKARAPLNPAIVLVAGILAASTSSILIRFAQEEVPSLVIASYRLSLATLILLPFMLRDYRSDITALNRKQWLQVITAGIFLGAHFGTWIASLEFTSVASSVVLVQTTPLFIMLLSPLVLREASTIWTYLGVAVAIIGSLGIALSDSCDIPVALSCLHELSQLNASAIRGDGLALSGAFAGAIYMIIGRATRKSMRLIPYITLIYAFAAITLISATAFRGLSFLGYSPGMYLIFLMLAVFPQLLAHSSYNWALKYLPATSVSLSLLGEPVAAAMLAYLILGESLPALRWMSAVVVLAGIALAFFPSLQGIFKIDTIQG